MGSQVGIVTGAEHRIARDLISKMRILIFVLVICVIFTLVNSQRNGRRNRNNRGQQPQRLRTGRQRNLRNNNNSSRGRNNNNNNNNRRPKQNNNKCRGGGQQPNHKYQGRDVLISWRVGCSKFTQSQAERFCADNNMVAVSLDSRAKEDHFLGLVAKDRQRYFWTGGKVNNGNIRWPSGRRYNNVNWSNTGGADSPQPDNREGDEFCLAVLNNFYADGIRFHDVSCHHKKPVICEAR